jgi:hypothetical protein
LTTVSWQESSSLEFLSMQVGKQTTDCLNFLLRLLNIFILSNKEKGVTAEAVATRMLQLGVPVAAAYTAYKEWASVKEDLKDYTAENESHDHGDPMSSREAGVALEAAVAKLGGPDPRAAGSVTLAPAGSKRRVQWPSSSTSPIFFEEACMTYIRPGARARARAEKV